jgi:hypothetical protein
MKKSAIIVMALVGMSVTFTACSRRLPTVSLAGKESALASATTMDQVKTILGKPWNATDFGNGLEGYQYLTKPDAGASEFPGLSRAEGIVVIASGGEILYCAYHKDIRLDPHDLLGFPSNMVIRVFCDKRPNKSMQATPDGAPDG